jgi:hypothetical protein
MLARSRLRQVGTAFRAESWARKPSERCVTTWAKSYVPEIENCNHNYRQWKKPRQFCVGQPLNEPKKENSCPDRDKRMSRFLRLITRLGIENHETNTKQYPANYKNSEGLAHLSCIVANNCHEWLLRSGLRAGWGKYRAGEDSHRLLPSVYIRDIQTGVELASYSCAFG